MLVPGVVFFTCVLAAVESTGVSDPVARLFQAHLGSAIYEQYTTANILTDDIFDSLVGRLPIEPSDNRTLTHRVTFTLPANESAGNQTTAVSSVRAHQSPKKSILSSRSPVRPMQLIPRHDYMVLSRMRLREIYDRLSAIAKKPDFMVTLAHVNYDLHLYYMDVYIRSTCYLSDCVDFRRVMEQVHFRLMTAEWEDVEVIAKKYIQAPHCGRGINPFTGPSQTAKDLETDGCSSILV